VKAEEQMQKSGAAFSGVHGGGMGSYEIFTGIKKGAEAALPPVDLLGQALAKISAQGMAPLKVAAAVGGSWAGAPGMMPTEKMGEEAKIFMPIESGIAPLDNQLKTKLQMQRDYDAKLRRIRRDRSTWELELSDIELEMERRGQLHIKQVSPSWVNGARSSSMIRRAGAGPSMQC
jgi:hypothetical protein